MSEILAYHSAATCENKSELNRYNIANFDNRVIELGRNTPIFSCGVCLNGDCAAISE